MFRIVLDSTVFVSDHLLSHPDGRTLLRCAGQGICTVHVPHVVKLEVLRRHELDLTAKSGSIVDQVEALEKGRFFLETGLANQLREATQRRVIEYPDLLSGLLASPGVSLVDWPDISHSAVVERDLARKKPFRRVKDGSIGYRDTLVWISTLEVARGNPRDTTILVSANRTDFGDKGEEAEAFDLDLQTEIDRMDLDLHLVSTLAVLNNVYLADAESELRGAITDALYEYNDQLKEFIWGWEYDPREGVHQSPRFDLNISSDLTDVSVLNVTPPEDIEIEMVSSAGSTPQFFECRHIATLEFDAFIDKSDYFSIPVEECDLEVWDDDWNDWTIWVVFQRTIRVTTKIEYNGREVVQVTFLAAERIPDQ